MIFLIPDMPISPSMVKWSGWCYSVPVSLGIYKRVFPWGIIACLSLSASDVKFYSEGREASYYTEFM